MMKKKSQLPVQSSWDKVVARSLQPLVKKIRALVLSSRSAVATSINTYQVLTNFEIGRLIVENEQQGHRRAEYGELVIRTFQTSSLLSLDAVSPKRILSI